MSDWFLHSIDGNSFYFRKIDMPDTDMEGFTLTYVKPGYTILTGDMGCLTWQRHEPGFDYGFPNNNTDIGYFAEKIKLAENQQTRTWNYETAISEIKNFMNSEIGAHLKQELETVLENEAWDELHHVIGQSHMLEDLYEIDSKEEWYEYDFGETWEYHFKRKFEMVMSVSDQILKAVSGGEV